MILWSGWMGQGGSLNLAVDSLISWVDMFGESVIYGV